MRSKQEEEEEKKKGGGPEQEDEVTKKRARERARKASAADPAARALLAQRARIAAAAGGDGEAKDDTEGDGGESKEGDSGADGGNEIDGDGGLGGRGEGGPSPPPQLRFLALSPPSNAVPVQIEMMKLTAQYAALSGRARPGAPGGYFLRELSNSVWDNPAFDFLRPRHGHFAYFTALVDLYRRLLAESVQRMGRKSGALG